MVRLIRVVAMASACLALAGTVRAESIAITSGSLVWRGTGTGLSDVTLTGDGFTFDGTAQFGVFRPVIDCLFLPECVAGSNLSLLAYFSGADIGGTATHNGVTITPIGSTFGDASLEAEWTGSLVIPAGFTGGMLSAPFTFTGLFTYEVDPRQSWHRVDLFGNGNATLTFSPYPNFPGAFILTGARYDFDAAATPEPASMVLLATGLGGLAAMRRRRRQTGVSGS